MVISWGKNQAQMTTEEAQTHALGIISAAEAARSDALIAQVLGGMGPEVALLLQGMRQVREKGDKFNSYKDGYQASRPEGESL